jgi:trans-2,3-dihydro-3-hydroxyanthranilate isomerase
MPRSYRYLHYDVFTDHLFGGNQLAVVLDARGLSADTMQAIAREMNFSETTFILPAERPDTDVRMRIFTTGEELPMAGHPTIGSTFALAHTKVIAPGRDRFVFGLTIGPTPVTLRWDAETSSTLTFAWMTQRLPSFGEPVRDLVRVGNAISVDNDAIASTGLPVQTVSCGVRFLFVPLVSRHAVDSIAVNPGPLEVLIRDPQVDAHGVFAFSTEQGADGAAAYSRMFGLGVGIVEDPATGGASGPLGCYLVRHKIVPADRADRILSLQGVKMGRPSHVHIAIGVDGSEITGVQVGGEAVLAGEGLFYIPES